MNSLTPIKDYARWTLQLCELLALLSLEFAGMYYLYKYLGIIQ